ncbi:GGDEF domain-containing protein [Parafannyhessea umbonata]|uniref:Diguanylate cyclase (GGDEF) domain-containing protein n=1 Tax=Parafannyhessea umbonata TaxID=604330 RepID=A0A1H9P157_9ACTN|nr:GGDEF domain-containing protein [Parafannyhessea umbonata]SER41787.1 diguanylate cyclase (GGDEF) domain-containing protein [Parafannyhessea umbonata]
MDFNVIDQSIRRLIVRAQYQRYEAGADYLKTARELVRQGTARQDDAILSFGYYFLAEALYNLHPCTGEYAEVLLKAIASQKRADENIMLGRSYIFLAADAANHNDKALSFDYLLEAQHCCIDADSFEGAMLSGAISYNTGYLYGELGEYRHALEHMVMAESFYRGYEEKGVPTNTLSTIVMEGVYHLNLGEKDAARRDLERASSFERSLGRNAALADRTMMSLLKIKLCLSDGTRTEAKAEAREVTQDIKRNGLSPDLVGDVCVIASDLIDARLAESAEGLLVAAEPLVKKIDIPFLTLVLIKQQIRHARLVGDVQTLCPLMNDYFDLNERLDEDHKRSTAYAIELRKSMEEMRDKEEHFLRENARLAREAEYDALTKLPNRYLLTNVSNDEFELAYHAKTKLGLEIFDIDDFKRFNDTHGHQMGDVVLTRVADVLRNVVADNENVFAARYGGDEFVMLYRDKTDEEVIKIAERIRDDVASITCRGIDPGDIKITQGIRNSLPISSNKVWDYLSVADYALYEAKRKDKGGIALTDRPAPADKDFLLSGVRLLS